MASKIATEMEISATNPLEDEVEELGNRLESVRQSISVLADIADARNTNELQCHQNIYTVKANLNEMQTVSCVKINLHAKMNRILFFYWTFFRQ